MIYTFYSYKGGVGRSMALANVADMLARGGMRVLMVDFDLEAPGLEQFFQINQHRVRAHEGLLDLLLTYKDSMSSSNVEPDGKRPYQQLKERFIVPVYENLPSGGRLDLMPSGQREPEDRLECYARELRKFDWQDFYFNWAGGAFFEWLRKSLTQPPEIVQERDAYPAGEAVGGEGDGKSDAKALYDVVLVDSRTGVTEMGGICAYQLADAVVMLCAPNHQNVEGTGNMVRNFFSPRVQELRRNRPLKVIVAPARTEQRDAALLEGFRERFEKAFDEHTPDALAAAKMSFWDLLIPYEPVYAFEEHVVSQKRMVNAFEKLVRAVAALAEPGTKLSRFASLNGGNGASKVVMPQYDPARRTAGFDAFISFHEADREAGKKLAEYLREQAGLKVCTDQWELVPTRSWRARAEEALFQSKCCLILSGRAGIGPWQNPEILKTLDARSRDHGLAVVPVFLPGAQAAGEALPEQLAQRQWINIKQESDASLSQLAETVRRSARAAQQTYVEYGAPYLGLRPFGETDAPLFFGREALVGRLVEQMRGASGLALVGPSGCGKSSLVQAGLFTALREDAIPGSKSWVLRSMRSGSDPLAALASAVGAPGASSDEAGALAEAMAADDDALDRHLREHLAKLSPGGGRDFAAMRMVLFIDQFEELFAPTPERESARRAFIANLLNASRSMHCPLVVVIALRADFLGECAAYPDLSNWIQSNLRMVSQMTPQELRDAIEKPAEKVGLAFEPGLVDLILADVAGSPGELPLLQFLLNELWMRRSEGFLTIDAYRACGGVAGAIASRAEAIYYGFNVEQQRIARRVMLRLIQPGRGRENTRRLALMSELATDSGDQANVRAVVDSLVEARLLTTGVVSKETAEQWVEISHESLVRNWQRLADWIDEERDALRLRLRVTEDAQTWDRAERDPSFLYRGSRLEEALQWERMHGSQLLRFSIGCDRVAAVLEPSLTVFGRD